MIKKLFVLLIIKLAFFLPMTSLSADDNMEVKYIQANTPAYYTGYLITPDVEKNLRLTDKELSYQKALNESLVKINNQYSDSVSAMNQRLLVQQDQIRILSEPQNDFWVRAGYFLLGVGITGLISYGLVKTIK